MKFCVQEIFITLIKNYILKIIPFDRIVHEFMRILELKIERIFEYHYPPNPTEHIFQIFNLLSRTHWTAKKKYNYQFHPISFLWIPHISTCEVQNFPVLLNMLYTFPRTSRRVINSTDPVIEVTFVVTQFKWPTAVVV